MSGFKSEAHRTKFAELLKDGKIKQTDYDKFSKATGNKKLPTRLTPKSPKGGRR